MKHSAVDQHTGRTYHFIDIDGKKAIRPYVTQQHWGADSGGFVIGTDEPMKLYYYDIEKDTLKELDECHTQGSADAVVLPSNEVFYRKPNDEIWKMNLATGEKKKLGEKPPHASGLSVIHATNDGKYVTSYWREDQEEADFVNGKQRIRIVPRLDCNSGVWDTTSIRKEFNEDPRYPDIGHPIINPVYDDLVFFCHEGRTEDIPDRLWIGNYATKETKNLFVQAPLEDGKTGETSGHEVWAADGEEIFFVKYTRLNRKGQPGIVCVSKDGSWRTYVNDDYLYWHCYPSVDKQWVAADTQISAERAEVVLIHTGSQKSWLLCNFYAPKYLHPYQPHPVISPDGKKVSWQMVDENGLLCCAWMDISDITQHPPKGGEEEIAPGVCWIHYDQTDSAAERGFYKGEAAYRIPYKKAMYLRLPRDAKAVQITYLDWGGEPVHINYTSEPTRMEDLAERENALIQLPKDHTLTWIKQRVDLEKMSRHSGGKYNSSIKISSPVQEVYIKEITLL